MLRVNYLIEKDGWIFHEHAAELISNSVEIGEWQYLNKNNKFKRVTDREMLHDGGWESVVYEFGCGLIHLSNKHSYKDNSRLSISQIEKERIIDYMSQYHGFNKVDVDINDIVEYLPLIYGKIDKNIMFFIKEIREINDEARLF